MSRLPWIWLVVACSGNTPDCPEGFVPQGELCVPDSNDAGSGNPDTGECEPQPEECNDQDDDCDGGIDEDVTEACGSNVGACVEGVRHCIAGEFGACDAEGPSAETCDGTVDEDCDGTVDESCACTPGSDRECGTDVGRCELGTQMCMAGTFGGCEGGVLATEETCDGTDDDCDGRVDEGNPSTGGACGSSVGVCRPGTFRCTGGEAVCQGDRGPREDPERTCNGEDDDCDGETDEGVSQTFYRDADGDGDGDPSSTMNACARPSGYVDNADDCDDDCASCRDGGDETCDGMDNDCDGTVDEGVDAIIYLDSDHDGYGAGVMTRGCPDDDYVTQSGDCAPADPDVNPGIETFHAVARSDNGSFDYNCDRVNEMEYERFDDLMAARLFCVDCPAGGSATRMIGTMLECGGRATTFICVPGSGRCNPETTENQLIRCR